MSPTPTPPVTVRISYALVTLMLVVSIGFGIFITVSVAVGLARHGDSPLFGDHAAVPIQISADDLDELPAGLRVASWVDARVELPHPTTQQMLLLSALQAGRGVLIVAGLWQLRRLLQAVLRDDPFGPDSVRRLRTLGSLLVSGSILVAVFEHVVRLSLFSSLPGYPSLHLGMAGFTVPGAALLGGLGAFVFAAIFEHGARLRSEVEGMA
jgi:hypothetical protein